MEKNCVLNHSIDQSLTCSPSSVDDRQPNLVLRNMGMTIHKISIYCEFKMKHA